MMPFSVLDLSPITEGSDAAQSFRNTLDLAQHAEKLGYRRFWLAEHHGMPGIASAATAVLIGHVAGGTSHHPRRRGRHHAAQPLAAGDRRAVRHAGVALSRAASTSAWAARPAPTSAPRARCAATSQSDADEFPQDVVELMDFMSDEPRQPVRAVPGTGLEVPVWILGSSTVRRAAGGACWACPTRSPRTSRRRR